MYPVDIYSKQMIRMLAKRYIQAYRTGGAAGAASFSDNMLEDPLLKKLVKAEVKKSIKDMVTG